MISKDEVVAILQAHFADAQIDAHNMGNKFEVRVISDAFEGLRTVKRQQLVYAALQAQIASGEIHALTIHAHTFAEHTHG